MTVDTDSLRYLPRRSSNNCDLQFANSERFKENYSIDLTHCHQRKTLDRSRQAIHWITESPHILF